MITVAHSPGPHVSCTELKTGLSLLRNLFDDETGQDLIEYALVAALVGLAAVASMKTLGTKIGVAFSSIATGVTSNV